MNWKVYSSFLGGIGTAVLVGKWVGGTPGKLVALGLVCIGLLLAFLLRNQNQESDKPKRTIHRHRRVKRYGIGRFAVERRELDETEVIEGEPPSSEEPR